MEVKSASSVGRGEIGKLSVCLKERIEMKIWKFSFENEVSKYSQYIDVSSLLTGNG